jgi:hypothetical protein
LPGRNPASRTLTTFSEYGRIPPSPPSARDPSASVSPNSTHPVPGPLSANDTVTPSADGFTNTGADASPNAATGSAALTGSALAPTTPAVAVKPETRRNSRRFMKRLSLAAEYTHPRPSLLLSHFSVSLLLFFASLGPLSPVHPQRIANAHAMP